MVNTALFHPIQGALRPAASVRNAEQALAYAFGPRHQLAQLAATGCLSRTFYADAAQQLDQVLALTQTLEPAFIAKAAIYGRQSGYMKDMPALLAASLAVRDVALLSAVFPRIIHNGKMLRNFVQILRSGAVGRQSLGSRPKKLVQHWLLSATEPQLLNRIGGGGTNCSAPLALLNHERAAVDVLILVSDNESWVDATRRGATQTVREWEVLKQRNPKARLVCIDIQPTATTQAAERHDILNVGGFSDAVFTMVANFVAGTLDAAHWVGEIDKVSLAVQ